MSKSDEYRAKKVAQSFTDKYYFSNIALKGSPDYKAYRSDLESKLVEAFQSIRAEQIEKDAGIAEWHWYYFRKANPTVEDRGHKDASFTIATKIRKQEVGG